MPYFSSLSNTGKQYIFLPRMFAKFRLMTAVISTLSLLTPSFAHAATKAYVTNSVGATVSVLNTATNTIVNSTSTGTAPWGIAVSGTGVYVANQGSASITVIDSTDDQVVTTISLSATSSVYGIATSGTGIYVITILPDAISVIDTTNNLVERSIAVGSTPLGIVILGTGAYVTNSADDTVSMIDIEDNQVEKTIVVGNTPYNIGASGTGVYVANYQDGTVSVIDTDVLVESDTISVGAGPVDVAFSGTGGYVTNRSHDTVSVFDKTQNAVERTISVGDEPEGIAINGTGAYVVNRSGDSVSIIDTTSFLVDATVAGLSDPIDMAFASDTVTGDPTLTLPSSVQICNDLAVEYSIPETLLSGSVQMQFYNTSTHVSVTLTMNNDENADFNLDLVNLTGAANVASGTNYFITTGTYVVYLTYQDAYGNAAGEDTASLTVTDCVSSSSSSSSSSATGGGGGGGGGCRGSACNSRTTTSSSSSYQSSSSISSSSFREASQWTETTTEEICDEVKNVSDFKDVPKDAWFTCFTKNVLSLKIFEGYKEFDGTPKGIFGPSDSITLGQLAKVGTILRNKEDLSPKPSGATWFEPYIGAVQAYDAAVFSTGTIDPEAPATRGEVIHTILEALGIPMAETESPYSDVSKSHDYASAIATATKLGIISGDKGTKNFRPNDPINRAEVAKMLSLALAHVGIQYIDDVPAVSSGSVNLNQYCASDASLHCRTSASQETVKVTVPKVNAR